MDKEGAGGMTVDKEGTDEVSVCSENTIGMLVNRVVMLEC